MPSTHPAVEEYLQTIAFLVEEDVVVMQARIAERLGYTPQAVSEVVNRLLADGYILRRKRQIELTARGWAIARSVIRRHRLAERLLVDLLGLSWSAAHHEAGRFEHVISEQVEARLVAVLGDPVTCPHGNPIPSRNQAAPLARPLPSLATFQPGQHVRIERIPEDVENELETLVYLERKGVVPGAIAMVEAPTNDGVMSLSIAGEHVTFGSALAGRLLGAPVSVGVAAVSS